MTVFFLICYVIGCALFLVDGICRLAVSSVRSTWMTPIGLFLVFLPILIGTATATS